MLAQRARLLFSAKIWILYLKKKLENEQTKLKKERKTENQIKTLKSGYRYHVKKNQRSKGIPHLNFFDMTSLMNKCIVLFLSCKIAFIKKVLSVLFERQ